MKKIIADMKRVETKSFEKVIPRKKQQQKRKQLYNTKNIQIMKNTQISKSEFRSIAKAVQNKIDEKDSEERKVVNIVHNKIDKEDPDYFQVTTVLMKEFTRPLYEYYREQILKLIREKGNLDDFIDYIVEFSDADNSVVNYWHFFLEDLMELGVVESYEIRELN